MTIGNIIETVPCIDAHMKSKQVNDLFIDDPTLRGIVVLQNDKPIGHISRTHFYQTIGTQYGYNLYMGRECRLLYKQSPLIVDYTKPLTEVSQLAMGRNETDLYKKIVGSCFLINEHTGNIEHHYPPFTYLNSKSMYDKITVFSLSHLCYSKKARKLFKYLEVTSFA